jgi:hypothetical protein
VCGGLHGGGGGGMDGASFNEVAVSVGFVPYSFKAYSTLGSNYTQQNQIVNNYTTKSNRQQLHRCHGITISVNE